MPVSASSDILQQLHQLNQISTTVCNIISYARYNTYLTVSSVHWWVLLLTLLMTWHLLWLKLVLLGLWKLWRRTPKLLLLWLHTILLLLWHW
jgi:hypothetical protein